MKKNIFLMISSLLIIGMFTSMFWTAYTGKNGNSGVSTSDDSEIVEEVKEQKQVIRMNFNTKPATLNPGLAMDPTSELILHQTFEGLTRLDLWGQRINAAAKAIKISDDKKTYTFTLRDAKWSNGDPVIAKDFEYAWKWVLDPNNHSSNAYQLYIIEGAKEYNNGQDNAKAVAVKALDAKTLEVTLTNPVPYFLELIASSAFFPVNSNIAERNPDWATDAGQKYTSNGPFEVTEWLQGDTITLSKNINYWDAPTVRLESIKMSIINDPAKELTMFKNNDLDLISSPAENLFIDDLGDPLADKYIMHTHEIPSIYFYKFNTKTKMFDNENIRKALALAIDRQKIVNDVVIPKGQKTAKAVIPPIFIAENDIGYFKDNDIKGAQQYLQKGLKELGYKGVSELPVITISLTENVRDKNIAEAIQQMWKENLGVKTTLNILDTTASLENEKELNYEITQMDLGANINEPINFLEILHLDDYSSNGTGWKNPQYLKLLEQAQKEQDLNKRQKLLKNAETILMKDMPVVPIYFYKNEWFNIEGLKDVAVSNLGRIQFKWAYFE